MPEYTLEDRRIFDRVPLRLSVRYCDADSLREEQAQTYDISANGIGLVASESLATHTNLDIWLNVHDSAEPINLKGTVVWSSISRYNKYRIGVELLDPDLTALSRVLRAN